LPTIRGQSSVWKVTAGVQSRGSRATDTITTITTAAPSALFKRPPIYAATSHEGLYHGVEIDGALVMSHTEDRWSRMTERIEEAVNASASTYSNILTTAQEGAAVQTIQTICVHPRTSTIYCNNLISYRFRSADKFCAVKTIQALYIQA